jgi:hypothetical protein
MKDPESTFDVSSALAFQVIPDVVIGNWIPASEENSTFSVAPLGRIPRQQGFMVLLASL